MSTVIKNPGFLSQKEATSQGLDNNPENNLENNIDINLDKNMDNTDYTVDTDEQI